MITGLSVYVLAGGESSRMQRKGLPADKALLEFEGGTLLDRALEKARALVPEPKILCGTAERCARLRAGPSGVVDRTPGCGPMGALDAALHDAPDGYVLLLPVDVPFLAVPLLTQLAEEGMASGLPVAQIVCSGRAEPLPLLVHTDARSLIARAVSNGEFKLQPTLQTVAKSLRSGVDDPFCIVNVGEDEGLSFFNVNTPEDLVTARRMTENSNDSQAAASD